MRLLWWNKDEYGGGGGGGDEVAAAANLQSYQQRVARPNLSQQSIKMSKQTALEKKKNLARNIRKILELRSSRTAAQPRPSAGARLHRTSMHNQTRTHHGFQRLSLLLVQVRTQLHWTVTRHAHHTNTRHTQATCSCCTRLYSPLLGFKLVH